MRIGLMTGLIPGLLFGLATLTVGSTGPKLFFDEADISAIRDRLDHEPYASMFARIAALPEATPADPANNIHVQYARADNALHYATLYLFIEDEQYAVKARDFSLQLVNDPDWARDGYRALSRAYMLRGVAIAYDLTKSSAAWDVDLGGGSSNDRSYVSEQLKAMGDSLIASGGSGYNHNNNWRAVRYSAAGLAYLATDEPVAASGSTSVQNAYNQVRGFFSNQLTTSSQSNGWMYEPVNYATYPAAFWGVFHQAAIRHDPSFNYIEDSAVPGIKHNLMSVAFSVVAIPKAEAYVGGGFGIVPDWANGHTSYRPEGTAGLGLLGSNVAPEYLPAMLWVYDNVVGAAGDQTWDATDRYMGLFSLLNYPSDIQPVNPAEIFGLTFHDPVNGMTMFRNRFQDGHDLLSGIQAKHRLVSQNHNGPDLNSFRIIGLNSIWATGGGNQNPAGQTTVFPVDPGQASYSNAPGNTVAKQFFEDGSGWAIVDGTNVGTSNHRRRFITDYSDQTGAEAVYIVADTSSNGQFWRLNTGAMNSIQLTDSGFIITSPDDHTMYGLVLHGDPQTMRTGELVRGFKIAYDGVQYDNRWVDLQSSDGDFLIVLLMVEAGNQPPAVVTLDTPAYASGIFPSVVVGNRIYEVGDDWANMSAIKDVALPGDVKLSGVVDDADLAMVQANLGMDGAFWMDGDLTGDGRVGLRDAFAVLENHGGPGATAIPEPASLAVLGLGAVFLLGSARRSRRAF
ncbi:MAG: PEP-CTERM sorting domain-containing protein [Phycisphaeraceae bacterium]|nr:PEP-CTERM sorting domain-containing protein [Phycisphaeraceae bacterium]